jgi:hypothetical protein
MPEENEWQPVRLAPLSEDILHHPLGNPERHERIAAEAGKIVHVRPIEANAHRLRVAAEMGCNSRKFFQVRPDYTREMEDRYGLDYCDIAWLCEHNLQAD